MKKDNFTPYGTEWIKEIMKFPKREIVEFLINKIKESENRGAFIDWCAEKHEEILKEYTGFLEADR